MFSTKAQLAKKTGPYGIGRFSFLQSLVTEFQDTINEGAKIEVLGNLANFAYDPVNYDYLRQLCVIDMFLDSITEANVKMTQFAIGGLCNLCLDKVNKEYILQNNGVNVVIGCLSSTNEETVISAMTTLMFLMTPESKDDITAPPVISAMLQLSGSSNARVRNLATVFLEDYCKKRVVEELRQQLEETRKVSEQESNLEQASV